MAHRTTLMEKLGVVVVRFRGDIVLDELERTMDEVPAEPWFRPHLYLIVDFREAHTDMAAQEVKKLADHAQRVDPMWGESKWAVLAKDDVIYGLSRIYMALTEAYRVKTHVFRSAEAANDWLGVDVTDILARAG